MKKIYVKPACREFVLEQHSQLLAGSGPGAKDQNNPGMGGGGGGSRRYRSFDDDEDEEEDY